MGPWTGKLVRGTSELDMTYGVPEKLNTLPANAEILKVTDVKLLNQPVLDEASGELWTMYAIIWFRLPTASEKSEVVA